MSVSDAPSSINGYLQCDRIDTSLLVERLVRDSCGAVATFEGRVRSPNEGHAVDNLFYEAYEPVANRQLQDLAHDACVRFDLGGLVVVHRTGSVGVGEVALFVAGISTHRSSVLNALPWIVDAVKANVAVWKQEYLVDGTAAWVEALPGS